jgi:hypothetical protein
MAKKLAKNKVASPKKKTKQGNGKFSKFGHKGGGNDGSTPSKFYRKKSRGQGKK